MYKCLVLSLLFFISLIVFSVLIKPNNIVDKIFDDFSYQLFFAILTAGFTALFISIFNRTKKIFELSKYEGIWYVIKFDEEYYKPEIAYVELKTYPNLTLSYKYTNLESLNTIVGTIYINDSNRKTGKLLYTYEQNDLISNLNSVSEKSIYFDKNIYKTKNPSLIRILNSDGSEMQSLERAENQKDTKIKVDSLYTERASVMANPFTESVKELFSKTQIVNKKTKKHKI